MGSFPGGGRGGSGSQEKQGRGLGRMASGCHNPQLQDMSFGAQREASRKADRIAEEIPLFKFLFNTQKCYCIGMEIIDQTPWFYFHFLYSLTVLDHRCIFNHSTTIVLVTAFFVIL